jgi:hypothetical protein
MKVNDDLTVEFAAAWEAHDVQRLLEDICAGGKVPNVALLQVWLRAAKTQLPGVGEFHLVGTIAPGKLGVSLVRYWRQRYEALGKEFERIWGLLGEPPSKKEDSRVIESFREQAVRDVAASEDEQALADLKRILPPPEAEDTAKLRSRDDVVREALGSIPLAERVRALRFPAGYRKYLGARAAGGLTPLLERELGRRGLTRSDRQLTPLGYWVVEILRLERELRTPHYRLLAQVLASRTKGSHLGAFFVRGKVAAQLMAEGLLQPVGDTQHLQLTEKGFDFAKFVPLREADQKHIKCWQNLSKKAWALLYALHTSTPLPPDAGVERGGLLRGRLIVRQGDGFSLTAKGRRVVEVGVDIRVPD